MKLVWAIAGLVAWQTSCARAGIAPRAAQRPAAASAPAPPPPAASAATNAPASSLPAPALAPPWTSRVTVDDVLSTSAPEQRFSKRCTLGPSAQLRFSLETAPFATTPGPPFYRDAIVIGEGADEVRIVTGDEHVRLVAFVGRKGLHTLTTERVDLTALATDDASHASIRVAGGVPVEQLEEEGGRRRVRLHIDAVDVFGWLPSEAVGTTYTPSASPSGGRIDGEIAWGATVVDARGNVLATFPRPSSDPPGTVGAYVELHAGAPSGTQAIVWRTRVIEVRGFVAASFVRSIPPTSLYSDSGEALGGGGAMSDAEPVSVAAGAGLYTREGFRVGLVLRRVDGFSALGRPSARGELRDVSVLVDGLDFVDLYAHASDIKPR